MTSHLINVEEVSSTRRKLKFSIPSSVVKEACEKEAHTLQTTAEVRGFRKGKAPLALIKKFFVSDIVKKSADKIINDAYSAALKTVDFQIVSNPEIEPTGQFDENNQFDFNAVVDINPKIDIVGYKDLEITLDPELNVTVEKELEKTLAQYSRAMGTSNSITDRPVALGDRVTVDYSISSENADLNGKELKNSKIDVSESLIPEFKNNLIGMNIGDEKTFTISYPQDYSEARFAGQTCTYTLKLNTIENIVPATIDDETAKKIGFASKDDLVKKLTSDIEMSVSDMRANAAFDQVVNIILEKNGFEVAQSLVNATVEKMIQEAGQRASGEQPVNQNVEQMRAQFQEPALKQVKGVLALGHIARQENVTVSDNELMQEISQFAQWSRIQPQDLYKKFGPKMFDEFKGQVMIRKVVNFIIDNARVTYSKTV